MTAIEIIKQAFQGREALALIVGDQEARRVLIAWTIYRPAVKDFEVRTSDVPIIVLNKLWQSVGPVDMAKLAADSNVPETRCDKIFKRLQNAVLVYPDGTLQRHARTLVDAEMGAHLESIGPKRRPVPAPVPAPPTPAPNPPAPEPPQPKSLPQKNKKKKRR